MEMHTNIYDIDVNKNTNTGKLAYCPYYVVITICKAEKYSYCFLTEPTEKSLRKCLNHAVNKYILGG